MKTRIILGLMAGALLFMQSCSKKETVLPIKTLNSVKRSETIPPGGMSGILPTGTYKFISTVSTIDPAINKSIGVTGGSIATGALIEQRDFAGTAQEWRITQTGYGTYSIINYNSGLAIDDQNASQADNNPIWQYPFNGNPAQEWIIEYQAYGVYRIKSMVNLNMGLHVANGSTTNGANLVLKTFGSGTTQQWGYFFVYAMPISTPPITIHTPDASHTDSYPRVTKLTNGNLLASFAYAANSGYVSGVTAKMYKSTNGGNSWTYLTDLTDTHRGLGINDPNPYVMPITMGTIPAGTLLCGVRSMGFLTADFIDIYKSTDGGTTWTYLSNVAAGNGWQHNVYEPFFLVDSSNRLICYYSDERDAAHSQKLVYQVSTDGGVTWSPTVNTVVALPAQGDRPGMFRASKMGNGSWIMTYEYVGAPNISAVHYKTSTDGVNWGTVSAAGNGVVSIDGVVAGGTPSVLWTGAGTTSGTVVVTSLAQYPASSRGSDNFVNFTYGTGNWYQVPQPLTYNTANAGSGYSRSISQSTDGKTLYQINCVDISTTTAKAVFVATPAW